jgi:hypothetical protein
VTDRVLEPWRTGRLLDRAVIITSICSINAVIDTVDAGNWSMERRRQECQRFMRANNGRRDDEMIDFQGRANQCSARSRWMGSGSAGSYHPRLRLGWMRTVVLSSASGPARWLAGASANPR